MKHVLNDYTEYANDAYIPIRNKLNTRTIKLLWKHFDFLQKPIKFANL